MIVEDEPLARQLLEEYIIKVPTLELLSSCGNPIEAIEKLRTLSPDILFLDVQMPEITGITLLKILNKKPHVILTTAYSEYAIEGYELDVADYLLKPITFERFLKAVQKVSQRIQLSVPSDSIQNEIPSSPNEVLADRFFFVKDGTKLVKIVFDEILYIEGLKDYVIIHTPKGKTTTLQKLRNLEAMLPGDKFIRVHNSYIVSVDRIQVIHRDSLEIGSMTIPVSDTYRRDFRKFIENKQLG